MSAFFAVRSETLRIRSAMWFLFFFFQAEDGIRDLTVTGVQTCALPISLLRAGLGVIGRDIAAHAVLGAAVADQHLALDDARRARDGVRVGAVDDGVLLPDLLARGRVQRHQAAIEGSHIDRKSVV